MDSLCLSSSSSRNDQKVVYTLCVNLPTDGSRGDFIHCFTERQPRSQGREALRLQLMILQNEENPFEDPSESDVEEAYNSCQLLDQDEEGDYYNDIL